MAAGMRAVGRMFEQADGSRLRLVAYRGCVEVFAFGDGWTTSNGFSGPGRYLRAHRYLRDHVRPDAASGVYRETAEVLRKAIAREEGRRDLERSFAKVEPPAALRALLAACWEIEDESGGWNGADVVDVVCEMLDAAGLDLTHPAVRDGGTGDRVDYDRVELRAILGLNGGR